MICRVMVPPPLWQALLSSCSAGAFNSFVVPELVAFRVSDSESSQAQVVVSQFNLKLLYLTGMPPILLVLTLKCTGIIMVSESVLCCSLIAHELVGTVTDPLGNGWYDSAGNENADKVLTYLTY